jgi:hypothetical protein
MRHLNPTDGSSIAKAYFTHPLQRNCEFAKNSREKSTISTSTNFREGQVAIEICKLSKAPADRQTVPENLLAEADTQCNLL